MVDPQPRSLDPVAAVVLAAGASVRMGQPKAAIRWRGRSFLEHVTALANHCDPVIIVTGAYSVEHAPVDTRVVHNPHWENGPLSSLQTGLREVPVGRGVLILTVDRPHVRRETIQRLLAAHRADADTVVQPAHAGERGHPILIPADLVAAALDLDARDTLRSLLRRPEVRLRRRTIAVEDPAVLDNLDHPRDLVRLPDP